MRCALSRTARSWRVRNDDICKNSKMAASELGWGSGICGWHGANRACRGRRGGVEKRRGLIVHSGLFGRVRRGWVLAAGVSVAGLWRRRAKA